MPGIKSVGSFLPDMPPVSSVYVDLGHSDTGTLRGGTGV